MSNYVSAFLMGGLGNQLFQIFTTIAYALKHDFQIIFTFDEFLNTGVQRPTYWLSLFAHIRYFTTSSTNSKFTNSNVLSFPRYNEQHFHFAEIPPFKNTNVILNGYFQSYKYFDIYKDNICSYLNLNTLKNDIYTEYLNYLDDSCVTSMHFRFGDYMQLQHIYSILNYKYYYNAIKKIIYFTRINNMRIIYFCQQQDNNLVTPIIEKLIHDFPDITFMKVNDTIDDWKQLLLMSCCSHNIIANSSFSWWGAYFNNNDNKIICYPDKWFATNFTKNNTKDLFPDTWKIINY